MKTRIQLAGFCYVIFALVTAHNYLASTEAVASRCPGAGVHTEQAERPVQNHQRLDRLVEDGIGPYDPNNLPPPPEPAPEPAPEPTGKAAYTVVVWNADWCGPCKTYKSKEVPALLKAGYTVKVLDYDTDEPPGEVRNVPTVMLYYKGTLLKTETYWKAKDIDKYVDNRMSLKG